MKSLNSKDYLFISFVSVVLSFGLLLFGITQMQQFVFYLLLIVGFILAAMNPRLLLWLFLAMVPLEIVIVSPDWMPISLRPYQLFGVLAILAVIFGWWTGKLDFKLLSFRKICLLCAIGKNKKCKVDAGQKEFGLFDRIVFFLPIFAFLSLINSPQPGLSLRLAIILVSFEALYWLVRNYTQNRHDLFEALWFFAIGTIVALLFGFYQGLANKLGIPSFGVFAERVNGTFTEPDWFGMFLAILASIILWFRLMLLGRKDDTMIGQMPVVKVLKWASAGDLFLIFSLILLTVSRSSWLGLIAVLGIYILLVGKCTKKVKLKISKTSSEALVLIVVAALAVVFIWGTGLSKFHFFNRAASSVSGEQLITISCQKNSQVPDRINSTDELMQYGCMFIDLEQIETEKSNGREVRQVLRPDPNVNIRKEIYSRSWKEIKKHPVLGQGLGTSGLVLGTDENGSAYNASNIFLETWLSLGFGGLLSLVLFFAYPLYWCAKNLWENKRKLESSFILLTAFAVLVPNLFNSGLLLGVFWVWLAAVGSVMNKDR